MLNYQVKIGLAPMRRDVTPRPGIFNWEKAEERGRAAVEYIEKHFASENVSFVDLKGINPVDVMYCEADAEKVIERFNQEKVDAVFIINSNFGNEEIAAQVARGVGKPVCIWAPIDTSFLPDGTQTDSALECARYDRIIAEHDGIDLQLLGIGRNAHIGFNEPDSCFACGTHQVTLTESTIAANTRFFENEAQVPRQAYSMGMQAIMQAKRVLLIASGADKAEAIRNSFFGPVTPQVPASILQLHRDVIVIADEAALADCPAEA